MVCGQRLVSLHAALEIGGGLGDGMLPLRCRGLALVACVVLGLADDVGGVEEGAGLVEGAGSVVLVDGAAEEGGGGGVALAKGAVERRIVTSRDCGVGASIEEELNDGGVAMLSSVREGSLVSDVHYVECVACGWQLEQMGGDVNVTIPAGIHQRRSSIRIWKRRGGAYCRQRPQDRQGATRAGLM